MSSLHLILISLVSLFISAVFGIQSYQFINSAVKTEAIVKSIDKGKRRITPTFEYKVKDKYYEFEGSSTSLDAYKIGDNETIYYDPENPEEHRLGTFMDLWFIPVFCGGFFVILLIVGVGKSFVKNTSESYTIHKSSI